VFAGIIIALETEINLPFPNQYAFLFDERAVLVPDAAPFASGFQVLLCKLPFYPGKVVSACPAVEPAGTGEVDHLGIGTFRVHRFRRGPIDYKVSQAKFQQIRFGIFGSIIRLARKDRSFIRVSGKIPSRKGMASMMSPLSNTGTVMAGSCPPLQTVLSRGSRGSPDTTKRLNRNLGMGSFHERCSRRTFISRGTGAFSPER